MKPLVIIGAALAILGLIGLAIPVFTTTQTKDVAKIGGLNIQSKERTSHVIPPLLSGGVLIIGLIVIGVGVYTKR